MDWRCCRRQDIDQRQHLGMKLPRGPVNADDFSDLQKALDVSLALNRSLYIPGSGREIHQPLTVKGLGQRIYGDGMLATTLKACGDFGQVFRFASTAAYANVSKMAITTDGTQTRAAHLDVNSVVIRFSDVYFGGNLNGDLIHSNGQNLDLNGCTFQVSSPNTYALNLDCYNQNTGVIDCRFGGVGKGVRVTNALTPGANRVEGLKLTGSYFINTGGSNIEIGTSLFTSITGCVLDQASVHAVEIQAGADNVVLTGNYIGSSAPSAAVNIFIAADAGRGHGIRGNVIGYGAYGIFCDATATKRVTGLAISDNTFNTVLNPLMLDSVAKCLVTGNTDTGTPANGSMNTKGTFGPGDYTIANNSWGPGASALWHPASVYRQSFNTCS